MIGACHPHGQGARRLLEWEGFRFDHVIDIFDGGPLMAAGRDSIRTARESRVVRVEAGHVTQGRRALLATNGVKGFACAPVRVELQGSHLQGAHLQGAHLGDTVCASPAALAALNLEAGETARIWIADAD